MKLYKRNKNQVDLYPRKDIYTKLEFDKILELLHEKCNSVLGQQYVERIKIVADVNRITEQLQQAYEFKQLEMFEEQGFPTDNYIDITSELKLLAINNSVLTEEQVFKVYKILQAILSVLQYFMGANNEKTERYPTIYALLKEVEVDKNLINKIKKILDEDGRIRSNASPELAHIRKVIVSRYRDLDRKFAALIREYQNNSWLTDTAESVRNGRRVLSVVAEHKRKVKGIVHDESSTGSTTFIEPDGTLQINNEIVELRQAEKREIYRILTVLTADLRPYETNFQKFQRLLGLLDFIRAKALLAIDINAHKPTISNDRSIEIFNARHPLLFLKNKPLKKATIPLSLSLNLGDRLLVVSGPNAGGKSVLLKTVGLMQLMLQAGLLVPTNDNSTMQVFRKIFVDMGDEQSIENDLSTYSSRLKNMRYFTDYTNSNTLLLIDEFGSGTDPSLGGPIAEAILEQLNKKFCYGVITTHYANIKVFADNNNGIVNGCMNFDYRTLSPKYTLEIGKPGSSFAFELATKSGLSKDIIEAAKRKVDSSYKDFDELLTTLQAEKQRVEELERKTARKLAEYETLFKDYSAKKAELDQKRKKILLETKEKAQVELQQANKKFENMVRELKENKAEKQVIKKIKDEIQKDKDKLHQSIETLKDGIFYKKSDKPITVGGYVKLVDGREVGQVLELRKNAAIVQFDNLKTNVKVKKLLAVEAVKPKPQNSAYSVYNSLQARSEFDTNIDIRGMRRMEALKAVEDLIDKALVFNVDELKIIHGIGDGILRRSIRDMLRAYKQVRTVRDEETQYGGQGVSIVELH